MLDAGGDERVVGIHPEAGLPILLKQGPYGPYVQLGDDDADAPKGAPKPKRASLEKGTPLDAVDLDDGRAPADPAAHARRAPRDGQADPRQRRPLRAVRAARAHVRQPQGGPDDDVYTVELDARAGAHRAEGAEERARCAAWATTRSRARRSRSTRAATGRTSSTRRRTRRSRRRSTRTPSRSTRPSRSSRTRRARRRQEEGGPKKAAAKKPAAKKPAAKKPAAEEAGGQERRHEEGPGRQGDAEHAPQRLVTRACRPPDRSRRAARLGRAGRGRVRAGGVPCRRAGRGLERLLGRSWRSSRWLRCAAPLRRLRASRQRLAAADRDVARAVTSASMRPPTRRRGRASSATCASCSPT